MLDLIRTVSLMIQEAALIFTMKCMIFENPNVKLSILLNSDAAFLQSLPFSEDWGSDSSFEARIRPHLWASKTNTVRILWASLLVSDQILSISTDMVNIKWLHFNSSHPVGQIQFVNYDTVGLDTQNAQLHGVRSLEVSGYTMLEDALSVYPFSL